MNSTCRAIPSLNCKSAGTFDKASQKAFKFKQGKGICEKLGSYPLFGVLKLLWTRRYSSRYRRKLCITVKLVEILKITTDWTVFVLIGKRKPFKTELTVFVELNYKPSRYRGHPKKLDCYAADNRLKKGVRLFWYSRWSPRKSILKFDNKKYLSCCHAPVSHRKNVSSFVKAHTLVI